MSTEGAGCKMTRGELQKRLQESAFGRNEVVFNAYFNWDSPEKKQPRCAACGQPIGYHDDGQSAAAPPTTAVPGPASVNATPSVAQPPARGVAPPASIVINVPMPPPVPQQPYPGSTAMYDQIMGGPAVVYGHPVGGAASPVGQLYNQYSPPPQVPYGVPMVMAAHPSQQPQQAYMMQAYTSNFTLPSKLVTGATTDTITEPFYTIYLVMVVVFALLALSSLATAVGLSQSYSTDDYGASSDAGSRRRNPYSYVSFALWGILALLYAYRCRRLTVRIHKGVSIEAEERKLLTFCITTKTIVPWSAVSPNNIEACADSNSVICLCLSPSWCVIILAAGNGRTIQLGRCSMGLIDIELRAWVNYIAEVTSSSMRNLHQTSPRSPGRLL